MGVQPNPYPLRISQDIMDKIKFIAKENGRSVNKEIEFQLKKVISDYEKEHGIIQFSAE